jgi:hypothetical protein
MYYHLLSQMFYNDRSVWTSVNKDNHSKEWTNVKNARRLEEEEILKYCRYKKELRGRYSFHPEFNKLIRLANTHISI